MLVELLRECLRPYARGLLGVEALLARQGAYCKLYNAQFRGAETEGDGPRQAAAGR